MSSKPSTTPARLTEFFNDNGSAFVDLAEVIAIASPLQKGNNPPARALLLRSGSTVYIHDTARNFRALSSLLPTSAEPWPSASRKKAASGRPAPKAAAFRPRRKREPRYVPAGDDEGSILS